MSDPYALYVAAAYLATAAILGGIVAASALAARRARRELEDAERLGEPR
ncbi:MAG: heme exporter protein CcmD [Pseudomonadota bacterium]